MGIDTFAEMFLTTVLFYEDKESVTDVERGESEV